MKKYEIELSPHDIRKMRLILENVATLLTDKDLLEYIGKKAQDELQKICLERLTTLKEDNIEQSNYMSSHHLLIKNDVIYLYNDSKIDIASKNMSETTKANYPAQLSLAKIVEYGIGYTGSITASDQVDNWEYDVNNHGYKGWYYIDDTGNTVWTNGFEGRLIFYNLKLNIEKNIKKWIKDYVEIKLKD